MSPAAFHAADWLLHAANAVLLFLLLDRLLAAASPARSREDAAWTRVCAALGAALWALHPLRVEAVAWLSAARCYQQALLFALASALMWERGRAAAATAFYALSMLTYPALPAFPFALAALDAWVLRRRGDRRLLAGLLGVSALSLASLAARATPGPLWRPPATLAEFGAAERAAQAAYALVRGVWTLFTPWNLSPVYVDLLAVDPRAPRFAAAAAAALALTAAAWRLGRSRPALRAVWALHVLLLLPFLGLTEKGHFANDRYTLFAHAAWAGLAAAALRGLGLAAARRAAVAGSALALAAALGVLSWRQCRVWRDSATLFRHAASLLGEHPYRANLDWRLGHVRALRGDFAGARAAFDAALAVDPRQPTALLFSGALYLKEGRAEEAERELRRALAADPSSAEARALLSRAAARR